MMVYCASKFKPRRKKKKTTGVVAKKFALPKAKEVAVATYVPPKRYYREDALDASKIPSLHTKTQFIPARTGMMDPMKLAKESPEVREAIIAKSKRLAPAYNKGAVQYVTDGADIETLGRKIK